MKRHCLVGLLVSLLVLTLGFYSGASGGTAEDPVVSKSYVEGTFFESVISSASTKISAWTSSLKTKYSGRAEEAGVVKRSDAAILDACADATLEILQSEGKYLYSTPAMAYKSFSSGDVISGAPGTMLMLTEGSFRCSSGSVINITQGKEAAQGTALGRFTAFMFPETGGKVEITSNSAKALIDGYYAKAARGYTPKYMDEAYALKGLGIVRGAANGMELYRGNTRAESITMLIRLLGEEKSALSGTHYHPFTDVDAWAKSYVGYAYRMGYTKGVSPTRYDGSSLTTAIQYMTFILRSLGYSEEAGDFKYLTAVEDALSLGVIDAATAREISSGTLLRDHVMHISYQAMSARVKGSNMTLLAKLVANGAVDSAAADEFLSE